MLLIQKGGLKENNKSIKHLVKTAVRLLSWLQMGSCKYSCRKLVKFPGWLTFSALYVKPTYSSPSRCAALGVCRHWMGNVHSYVQLYCKLQRILSVNTTTKTYLLNYLSWCPLHKFAECVVTSFCGTISLAQSSSINTYSHGGLRSIHYFLRHTLKIFFQVFFHIFEQQNQNYFLSHCVGDGARTLKANILVQNLANKKNTTWGKCENMLVIVYFKERLKQFWEKR